jgi:heterodisulfide reductase subunit A
MGKVLVLGGGISGMQSALDLANMGHKVYLVEKESELGGNLRNLYKVFPTNEEAAEVLSNFREKTKTHKNISVLTGSTLCKFEEKASAFKVTVDVAGKRNTFDVDAVILATGFVPYDPTEKREYGYNRYKDVITALDLERMMKEGKLARPSNSEKPKSVTFVQCVGFRDVKAYRYCSYFCCTLSVKNALLIKEEHSDIEVAVMYMDIRTPYVYENLYSDARNIGVKFIRARPAEIFEDGDRLVINYEDTLTSEIHSVESDLVVLSVGGIPPPETEELSQIMKVSLDEAGFFKVYNRPSGTDAKRIFVIGAACGPKDIDYSLSQAGAAASQINKLLGGKT